MFRCAAIAFNVVLFQISEDKRALIFKFSHLKDRNLACGVLSLSLCVWTMPLFRSSPKSPQELVKNLDEALKVMRGAEGGGKKAEKASSESVHLWY